MEQFVRWSDALNLFKGLNFYHPKQCGSASMKAVLPAVDRRGNTGLEIQEGTAAASREFLRVTFGDVSESEGKRVRRALYLYCGRDTEGMILASSLGVSSAMGIRT
jgi:hypothetical protein